MLPQDGSLSIWDVRSGVHQGQLLLPGLKRLVMSPHAFAASPDSQVLVSGGPCPLLLVWRLEDGVLKHAVRLPEGDASWGVVQLAFLPDSQTVAGARWCWYWFDCCFLEWILQ